MKNNKSSIRKRTPKSISIRDKSARKQAESELQKSKVVVERSSLSIVITDSAGNIEYVNSKFEQYTAEILKQLLKAYQYYTLINILRERKNMQ